MEKSTINKNQQLKFIIIIVNEWKKEESMKEFKDQEVKGKRINK
jgi:hypothetical protein